MVNLCVKHNHYVQKVRFSYAAFNFLTHCTVKHCMAFFMADESPSNSLDIIN